MMQLSVFIAHILLCCVIVKAYKPVVIIHGIWDKKTSLDILANRIREAHPGTNVTIINMLHGRHSLDPMWHQVAAFGQVVNQISNENPDGIHLIGYSQGGLISRGIVESYSGLNIKSFVSLSSPQGGQYGDSFLRLIFKRMLKRTAHRVFYTETGQRYSVANYWNDPHHQTAFLQHSKYLAIIDNIVPSTNSSIYKENFVRLDKLVLIGGPDDGVITPWQSSQFGIFDDKEVVIAMKKRAVYTSDLFGLRTLNHERKLILYTMPGVGHHQWHNNLTVIDNFILPHLN